MDKYQILAWFFPNKCLICGEYVPPHQFVCAACVKEATTPIVRNFNIKVGRKAHFFKVYAPYNYEEGYRKAVERFKFAGRTGYARRLAGFAYTVCGQAVGGIPLVTWVPMERKKQRKRGYNQAELLAKALGACLGAECRPLLTLVRDKKVQHALVAAQRKHNVKDVYRAESDAMGQNIILVDDIITTGATLCACARALYGAGATTVVGLAVANTPRGTESGNR